MITNKENTVVHSSEGSRVVTRESYEEYKPDRNAIFVILIMVGVSGLVGVLAIAPALAEMLTVWFGG